MKDDKFLVVNDDDVEITYKRRKTSTSDDIHGFNPIVIFALIVISLFCAVAVKDSHSSNQQSPIIINNK